MDVSVIQSYLVELGFDVDKAQLAAFNRALESAAATAAKFAGKISGDVIKAGAAITTMLTGVAGATLGLADAVAESDIQIQRMARRMFISTDAARSLKFATDAMGMSLEEILWGTPEDRERARVFLRESKELIAALPKDFETQMRRIRDIRQEVSMLTGALKTLAMATIADLSRKLFGDENALESKLLGALRWLIANIPMLADKFSTYLAPVLRDVGRIFHDVFDISKLVAGEFLRLIGVFFGDPRLEKGPATLDKVGLALDHVSNFVRKVFDQLDRIANLVDAHPWMLTLFGAGVGALAGGTVGGLPGAALGAVAGGFLGHAASGNEGSLLFGNGSAGGGNIVDQARQAAAQIGAALNVPASVLFGQFEHETGNFTNRGARELHNLAGIRDPATGDYRNFSSIADFVKYYVWLITHRYASAIGAANAESYADALKHGSGGRSYYEDSESNYAAGIKRWQQSYQPISYTPSGKSLTVGSINVTVTQPNATASEIAAKISDTLGREYQRETVQTGGSYA